MNGNGMHKYTRGWVNNDSFHVLGELFILGSDDSSKFIHKEELLIWCNLMCNSISLFIASVKNPKRIQKYNTALQSDCNLCGLSETN